MIKSYYLTRTGCKLYSSKTVSNSTQQLQGIGFKLTIDSNYDIDNKRLTNVADPEDYKDAVNKEYIDLVLYYSM
jgi:hypothetical protein